APAWAQDNEISLTLGGSANSEPTYFGSDESRTFLSPEIEFNRLKFGRFDLGGGDVTDGLGFKGGFRFIRERTSDDGAELTGLNDVDAVLEIGGGLDLSDIPDGVSQTWGSYAFAEVRYGVVGHEAFVAEAGADLIYAPTSQLAFRVGPRLFGGDDDYTATYFGVTAQEAVASEFEAFDATGGVLSRGISARVNYEINENWGLEGAVTYQEFLNDAADSPIVQGGSAEQTSISLSVTRALTFNF
ncbi:MAG: MipA/OmpV family protein, partial [Pseudomonadota bacterium]